MGIKLRKHGTVTATFATAQQVDISHANDSIRVGDGTDLMGPLQNVGGVLSYPMKLMAIQAGLGLALDATLTGGTQRSKITDGSDNVGIETVGAEKALKVAVISTVGGGAAPAFTDDAAFTIGTTQCTPIGALADETAPDSVDEGDVGVLRMTLDRLLKIQVAGVASGIAVPVTDNAGSLTVDDGGSTLSIDDGGASITVDGTVAVTGVSTEAKQDTMITSLQLLDNIVRVEDEASADGHSGVPLLAVRKGTPANTSGTDGDYEFLQMSAGRLWASATIDAALPAGTNAIGKLAANSGVDIGDVDVTSVTCAAANAKVDIGLIGGQAPAMNTGNASAGTQRVVIATDQPAFTLAVGGMAAHDAVRNGNPVAVGGKAYTTSITSVAAGDTVDFIADKQGALVTVPNKPREFIRTQQTTISASTSETTIITAGGAGVFNDIISLTITNSSSTALIVTLKDATAGTTRAIYALAANGGITIPFPTPLAQQAAANNNWTLTCGTSVSSIYVSAVYIINT